MIDNKNTSDLYAFTIPTPTNSFVNEFRVRLSGLSSDADLRVIADRNGNKIVDSGDDELKKSANLTNQSEEIRLDPNLATNYIAQVYQYSGNTNYTIGFQGLSFPNV